MNRTIVLNLHPMPAQAAALKQTLTEYNQCYNVVAAEGYTAKLTNGVELHHRTYYALREQHPNLPAQLVVSARMKSAEAVKSVLDRLKKGRKAAQPRSSACPIRYDMRSYWVKWDNATCSLATVAGRVELAFFVPDYAAKYIGGKVASADLCYRKGKWTLHVVVDIPTPDIAPTAEVVGVDLGISRPAVASNRLFYGSRYWRELDNRIFRLRRKLQAKGTKSAKHKLRKLAGKLLRQRRDHDHVLSRRIVDNTSLGGTIVLENLKQIRTRVRSRKGEGQRRLHSWTFAQLQGFVRYKAEECGQRVELIDPRHTSQTCSRCGFQHRNNRTSQSVFRCKECGYQLNADLNASYNIRTKYILASGGIAAAGGLPVNQPIVSVPVRVLGTSPQL